MRKELEERREVLEIPSTQARDRKFLVDQDKISAKTKPAVQSVPRNTQLFERLQSFLPSIIKANEELDSAEACEFEAPEGGPNEGPVVELDLACGLFDLKDEAAVLAAQRAVENQAAHSHDRESSDDDDDKEPSDDHGGEENVIQTRESKTSEGKPNSQKPNNRAQKRKHHPGIEEIT